MRKNGQPVGKADELKGQCRFVDRYFDLDSGKPADFKCQDKSIGKEGLCKFHDAEYWKENYENVSEGIYQKITEGIIKNTQILFI